MHVKRQLVGIEYCDYCGREVADDWDPMWDETPYCDTHRKLVNG